MQRLLNIMKPTARDYYFLIVGLCFSAYMSMLNGLLALIIFILTLLYFLRHNSRTFRFAAVICPILILPIWNVSTAILDYNNGNAKIKFGGHPGYTAANISHEYRMGYEPMGCLTSGIAFMTSDLYNSTVQKLVHDYGFQKESYTGQIPTREDAIRFIESPQSQNCKVDVSNGELIFSQDTMLMKVVLKEQFGMFPYSISRLEQIDDPKIYIKDDLAVAQFNKDWIYLIDTQYKKFISYYRINL